MCFFVISGDRECLLIEWTVGGGGEGGGREGGGKVWRGEQLEGGIGRETEMHRGGKQA